MASQLLRFGGLLRVRFQEVVAEPIDYRWEYAFEYILRDLFGDVPKDGGPPWNFDYASR